MTRTEINITVEHKDSAELLMAIEEATLRMIERYSSGNFETDEGAFVEFSMKEEFVAD